MQEQAGQIFIQRDPVVWTPAPGFFSYHLPAPYGKNERLIAVVRGSVSSIEQARETHNALVGGLINKSRQAGDLSHDVYLRLAAPGTPEPLELFAIDVWMSADKMMEVYTDPEFVQGFDALFPAGAATLVWTHPVGDWVEW